MARLITITIVVDGEEQMDKVLGVLNDASEEGKLDFPFSTGTQPDAPDPSIASRIYWGPDRHPNFAPEAHWTPPPHEEE